MRFLNENVLFLTIILFVLGSVLMCAYGVEENKELSGSIHMPDQQHIEDSAAVDTHLVNELPDNNHAQSVQN
jgi:hypothetical protein